VTAQAAAPHVAVVGGGLAGITAAIALAETGTRVTLLESKPRLGGATCSFSRGELTVDNGQHVFLRCCSAYRGLLARLGMTGSVTLQDRFDVTVLRPGGRAALCGSISDYDRTGTACGPRNLFLATAKNLTLRGFRGSGSVHRMAEMQRELGSWLRAGRLRHRETVVDGLANAPEALIRVLAGETVGKTLVKI